MKDKTLFEIDVAPVVLQTQEIYPDNKMHWKFYELSKFKKSGLYKSIGKLSEMKHQWLEFLIKCGSSDVEPERNEIIKEAYKIMEIAKWAPDVQALYWKRLANEEDAIRERAIEIEEAKKETEIKKAIEIVQNGIKQGLDVKILSSITKLDENYCNTIEKNKDQSIDQLYLLLGFGDAYESIAQDSIELIGDASGSGSDGDLMGGLQG